MYIHIVSTTASVLLIRYYPERVAYDMRFHLARNTRGPAAPNVSIELWATTEQSELHTWEQNIQSVLAARTRPKWVEYVHMCQPL